MRIKIVWVGRTKSAPLRTLVDEYLERLTNYARCEITELRESTAREDERIKSEEGERIINSLNADVTMILLDREGHGWSSEELADQIERWQNESRREVAFVIGGHLGVGAAVRGRAQQAWSLGRLTLTHEMARLILVEQLYRAHTILRGAPYHK